MAHLSQKETITSLHAQDALDCFPAAKEDISALYTYLLHHNPLSAKIFTIAGPEFGSKLLFDEVEEFAQELMSDDENQDSIKSEGGDTIFFCTLQPLLYNSRSHPAQKRLAIDAYYYVSQEMTQRGINPFGALRSILQTKILQNYPPQVMQLILGETDEQSIDRYKDSLGILGSLRDLMPGRRLTNEVSSSIIVDRSTRIIGIDPNGLGVSAGVIFEANREDRLPTPLLTKSEVDQI